MSRSNQTQWNGVLENASFGLMRIIIKHYEISLKALHNKESQLLSFHSLSVHEQMLLAAYQQKKTSEIYATKCKKLLRDGVAVPCTSQTPSYVAPREVENATPAMSSVASNCIINLSSSVLSKDEMTLLSRGLSFCPATGGFSEFEIMKDLDNFARNLRLREYFYAEIILTVRPGHFLLLNIGRLPPNVTNV